MGNRSTSVEMAVASTQLQSARIDSSRDGLWRIILTPDNAFGKMLRDTIEAISGSGRTELFSSGGKVTVTKSAVPFGDPEAILITLGKWDTLTEMNTLRAWKDHCKGSAE